MQFPAPYDPEHLSMPRLSIVANDSFLRKPCIPGNQFAVFATGAFCFSTRTNSRIYDGSVRGYVVFRLIQ